MVESREAGWGVSGALGRRVTLLFGVGLFGLAGWAAPVAGTVAMVHSVMIAPVWQGEGQDTVDVGKEIRELGAKIEELQAVGDANQRMLEQLLRQLTDSISNQRAEGEALRSELGSVSMDIDSLRETSTQAIDALNDDLDDLNELVDRIGNQLQGLVSQVGEVSDTTNNEGLAPLVNRLNTTVEQMQTELLAGQSDVRDSVVVQTEDLAKSLDIARSLWFVLVGLILAIVTVAWLRLRKPVAVLAGVGGSFGDVAEAINDLEKKVAKLPLDVSLPVEPPPPIEPPVPDPPPDPPKPDHSLALQICNEINRIRNNLGAMDSSIRGHSHLVRSTDKVIANLKANGYEMVDYVGKEYKVEMRVKTQFVSDPTLGPDEMVIRRVLKPEVRYNDNVIQKATVQVAQG